MTRRAILSGYYGFQNAGDEAILLATLGGLSRRLPGCEPVTLCAHPEEWSRRIGSVCIDRYDLRAMAKIMTPGSLLVSGGGGLFQDVTSRKSLLYYLAVLHLARWRRMKTMVYAQGIGPLTGRLSRLAVRATLDRVDCITVRDEASLALLREIGVSGRVELTADPAFTIAPESDARSEEILRAAGVPPQSLILAVALRTWPGLDADRLKIVAAAVNGAARTYGFHLLLTPMQEPEDREFAHRFRDLLTVSCSVTPDGLGPREIAGVFQLCHGLVAMRLHALIFASLSGTPSVALSYDPKVGAAARQLGLCAAIQIEDIEQEILASALETLAVSGPDDRLRIRNRAATLRDSAERNFKIMAELLFPHS